MSDTGLKNFSNATSTTIHLRPLVGRRKLEAKPWALLPPSWAYSQDGAWWELDAFLWIRWNFKSSDRCCNKVWDQLFTSEIELWRPSRLRAHTNTCTTCLRFSDGCIRWCFSRAYFNWERFQSILQVPRQRWQCSSLWKAIGLYPRQIFLSQDFCRFDAFLAKD